MATASAAVITCLSSESVLRDLEAVLQRADHTIVVLSDEPYKVFAYDGAKVPETASILSNCIITTSYSKTWALAGERIELAGILLDEGAHTATSGDTLIDLTPREFELLACLMRHGGKVLSRDVAMVAWEQPLAHLSALAIEQGPLPTLRSSGDRWHSD